MAYLECNADKRVNPQAVLPKAKTIITLTVSYAGIEYIKNLPEDVGQASSLPIHGASSPCGSDSGMPPELSDKMSALRSPSGSNVSSADERDAAESVPTGIVARYARFEDYHQILGDPLKSLASFVNELGGEGTRSLWYVDTGPLLERDLAQRAGLGFVGKHTNLISRRLGNWIFLAEILTTLPLEPDPPERNLCGTCTRCLSACPTRAIVAPFELDARRCISYLTIELKGAIPVELRPAVGARIFGCDDCLAVCPWNRFAREGRLMRERARSDLAAPDLVELLSLDEAAFNRRFAGTPIRRAKRRGFLRNVCVALGNVGDQRSLPALARAAQDAEPLVAEHARWAIQQIEARAKTSA